MPVATALGMVFVLWLAVGAACVGWGTLLFRREAPLLPVASRFWAGFAVVLGLLQLWHFFLPVDWRASLVLLGGGITAGLGTRAFRLVRPEKPGWAVAFVLLALWLAYRGLDFPRNYDSGLYHFSAIRWINEHPVVPGLANLHERLGFSPAYFHFVALLNVHPFLNEGHHAAGSLLWFVLTAPLLAACFTLLRAGPVAGLAPIAQCLLLPAVLAHALGGDISSPTPDLAVFAVGVVVFLLLVQWLETAGNDPTRRGQVVVLAVLLAAGCTLKPSFAIFGLAVAVILLFRSPGDRRVTLLLGGAAACWGFPAAVNGTVLSGYPAFPSTLLGWPADWRLPVAVGSPGTELEFAL